MVPLRKPEIMLSCIVTRLHRKRKKNFFFFSKYPMYSSEMLSNRIIHVSKKRRRTFPGAVSFKPLIQFYFSKELVFFCCTVIEIYQSLQVFVSFHSLSLILREESLCFFRICSHQGIVTNFSVQEFLIISLGSLLSRVNFFSASGLNLKLFQYPHSTASCSSVCALLIPFLIPWLIHGA